MSYKLSEETVRCCDTCINFNVSDSTCDEGGSSEIDDPYEERTEDDCNAWEEAHNYEWALRQLGSIGEFSPGVWPAEVGEVVDQAEQALRDCLELGLRGG